MARANVNASAPTSSEKIEMDTPHGFRAGLFISYDVNLVGAVRFDLQFLIYISLTRPAGGGVISRTRTSGEAPF